ncbi:proximal tail sheath stabilization protein [Vibrio phage VP-1]|uniref:Proximal tail sheath stabilization protein n=1 Tax=Vibrio phage VP-1 TaxID=2234088 RepID=A0A4P2TE88_9CAUD|nr:proximal tail sheath stabilization protein [Vibrio phage VP-1]
MSLFKKYYYHGSVELYTYVMACLFKDIKLFTEGKLVTLPISYFGGRHNTVEDPSKGRVLPRGTLKFDRISPNDAGQLQKHGLRMSSTISRNAAVPRVNCNFDFTLSFQCKHAIDAYQLVEQVVPAFSPTLDFEIRETDAYKIQQNIKVKLEEYDIDEVYEGDGEELSRTNVMFRFSLAGHLYRRPESMGIIKTIHIHLTLEDNGQVVTDWLKVNQDGSVTHG